MRSAYLEMTARLLTAGRPLVFFDTEATGLLRPGQPCPVIWEIAAFRRGRGERWLDRLLRPGMAVPEDANLAGIEPWLPESEGDPARYVLIEFASLIEDAILIGHGSETFDVPLLRATYEAEELPIPLPLLEPFASIDTRILSRHLLAARPLGERVPENTHLTTLARFFGIPYRSEELHRARTDVELLRDVFDALVGWGLEPTP